MQAKFSNLWLQTHITVSFRYAIFVYLPVHAQLENFKLYKDVLPIEWFTIRVQSN